jgi:hypothetical protein
LSVVSLGINVNTAVSLSDGNVKKFTLTQDIVDEIGAAVGIEMDDAAFLRTSEMLEQRDDSRWELDPKSSEDYGNRRE